MPRSAYAFSERASGLMVIGPAALVQREESSFCFPLAPVCSVTYMTGAHRKVIGACVLWRTDRLLREG